MAGTQQAQFQVPAVLGQATQAAKARIEAPTQGTLLALDPDIPAHRQQLQLRSNHPAVHWLMDGVKVGEGASVPWPLWPGTHVLQLHDGRGRFLDRVTFEVRGAAVRQREQTH